jgi:hypothetical protein
MACLWALRKPVGEKAGDPAGGARMVPDGLPAAGAGGGWVLSAVEGIQDERGHIGGFSHHAPASRLKQKRFHFPEVE